MDRILATIITTHPTLSTFKDLVDPEFSVGFAFEITPRKEYLIVTHLDVPKRLINRFSKHRSIADRLENRFIQSPYVKDYQIVVLLDNGLHKNHDITLMRYTVNMRYKFMSQSDPRPDLIGLYHNVKLVKKYTSSYLGFNTEISSLDQKELKPMWRLFNKQVDIYPHFQQLRRFIES